MRLDESRRLLYSAKKEKDRERKIRLLQLVLDNVLGVYEEELKQLSKEQKLVLGDDSIKQDNVNTTKNHKCKMCSRPINHEGNCLACNIYIKYRKKELNQKKKSIYYNFICQKCGKEISTTEKKDTNICISCCKL